MNRKIAGAVVLGMVLSMGFVFGCGGGGGGSAPFLDSYAGTTEPAYIDTTEAVNLAMEAGFAGREVMERLDKIPELGGGDPAAAGLAVAADPLAVPSGPNCLSTTESGSQGGTLVTGYCVTSGGKLLMFAEASEYATTTQYMDGYLEILTDFESEGQYTFESLAYADSTGEDFLLDGTIMASESGSTTTMEFNLVVIDDPGTPGQKMGYLRNYRMSITDRTTHEEVSLDGRYYHGDDGYVDISTPVTLMVKSQSEQVDPWDDYPYDGALRFTGMAGNYVEVQFGYDQEDPYPGNTYGVIVEILGDAFEPNWESGVRYWVTPD